jgi:hypothetical protein
MKLKVSAHAAVFMQKETAKEEKLRVVRGEVPMTPPDLFAVLVYLSLNDDDELKAAACRGLQKLPEETLLAAAEMPDIHPRILDVLVRLHSGNRQLVEKITSNANVDRRTLRFIAENCMTPAENVLDRSAQQASSQRISQEHASSHDSPLPDEIEGTAGEDEEFQSKFKIAHGLTPPEKIKLAITGDKEWRAILIKDNNKLVTESVLKNPRITEQEILLIAKSSVKNDEIIRIICTNKEWTKNYQLRKTLIENSRTPLQYALNFLSLMTEKDLSFLVKSKNVSSVITTQARRMLTNKKLGK